MAWRVLSPFGSQSDAQMHGGSGFRYEAVHAELRGGCVPPFARADLANARAVFL
jgi:hypothetical protein